MKTAIKQLMEYIESQVEVRNDNSFVTPQNKILSEVYYKLQCLMPNEKQQIVDAYNQGFTDGLSVSDTRASDNDSAIDYYNQTFENQ